MLLKALAIAVFFLSGCAASLDFVKPDSAIEGVSIRTSAIRIGEPFSFRPALYTATYPAGTYLPKFEDKDGVYFKAPEQILAKTVAGGRTMQGGIYVFKQSWNNYRAYIDEGGKIYKFRIEAPIDLTVARYL